MTLNCWFLQRSHYALWGRAYFHVHFTLAETSNQNSHAPLLTSIPTALLSQRHWRKGFQGYRENWIGYWSQLVSLSKRKDKCSHLIHRDIMSTWDDKKWAAWGKNKQLGANGKAPFLGSIFAAANGKTMPKPNLVPSLVLKPEENLLEVCSISTRWTNLGKITVFLW